MPNERAGDPGNRGSAIADLAEAAGPGSSMAATCYWSARGLALERLWHVASPWAATG